MLVELTFLEFVAFGSCLMLIVIGVVCASSQAVVIILTG